MVGKTLALGLIHHCLGANADKKLAAAVPDWFFFLDFEINGKKYRAARSGDGKQLFFNEKRFHSSNTVNGSITQAYFF